MDAYDLVLQGSYHLARRGEDSLRLSIGLFQEALQLDDAYADAYVGLATSYAVLPFYSREAVEGSFDLATAILEKGSEMNANVDVLGASIIAFIRYHTEWQWIEAEEAFDTALRYTPNDSDLLNWYSVFLAGVGRIDESLDVAARARDLDRLSPVVNQRLAVAHLWAGNNEQANEYFEIANELGMAPATQPEAYVILLMRQGEYALALQLLSLQQMMMGYDDAWVEALFVAMQDSQYRADAIEVVLRAEQNGDITPLHLFGVWLYLEEEERAIDAALALIKDRAAFNSEVLFTEESASLRQHPRFGEIIRGIRLDVYWNYFGWPPMCESQGADIVCY
jgi:Tfp pilus assembly protein PilF